MSDVLLDKVRKLLAKAEDPACTPSEAEAFTAKAAELIAKYGVDQALLADRDPERDPVGDRVIDLPAPYALDKCTLLAGIALELRCRAVRKQERDTGGRSGFAIHLFGFASDLERTEMLFTSLLVQAGQALAAQPVPPWESAAAYRRSWLAGFTQAIVLRLRSTEQAAADRAEPSGRSVALVLADRSGAVEQAVADAYPRLRLAARRRLGGSGASHGYAAGQRADLGGTRLAGAGHRAVPAPRNG